ncbi:MAG: PDZ domain-containing protein [Planctomycetes bacterium]|nr:PDZ domain-containing protein [Planctomycetota bacterium]
MHRFGPVFLLAASLAACQEPLPEERGGSGEEVRRTAEAVNALLAANPPEELRRMSRSEEKERRLESAIRRLDELLSGLSNAREDPALSGSLPADAWRALSRASEAGRAALSSYRQIQRDIERPRLGLVQAGHYLGPELAGHLGLEAGQGFLVGKVEPGSPAWEWGIRDWDVVLSIDEVTISDLDLFWMRYEALDQGATVRVEWIHRGERRWVDAKK